MGKSPRAESHRAMSSFPSRPVGPVIRKPRKTLSQIFLIPTILFVLGLFGLILALLENGWVDSVATLALSTSLMALTWSLFFKTSRR